MVRGGAQPQLSAALHAQADASSRMRELVAWIAGHLTEDLSVEALAERACMSPRHFARAFTAQTHTTPARFVEHLRVAHAAELLLQTGWTQDKVASRSGFGSVDALQRAFRRQWRMSPDAYRSGQRQG
jgi:transcriptional regulator GlxA family with amidase domain